jgi:hypothetical protein
MSLPNVRLSVKMRDLADYQNKRKYLPPLNIDLPVD